MSGRTLLAFDFGTKSIGVAVGQEITGTARPLTSLKASDGRPDWQQIEKLLKEWQPQLVIVGLPLNMDGTEQLVTSQARNFANRFMAVLVLKSNYMMNVFPRLKQKQAF